MKLFRALCLKKQNKKHFINIDNQQIKNTIKSIHYALCY
ncbi:hypothetical protein KKH3_18100 [Pectobacterium actinidiae]|nr:hypothetical protein KKH3_18100 [Pectobacterium actinidiae]